MAWHDLEKLVQEKYFRFVRENTGSDAEAARLLGLAPPNYHRVCKRLGIK
jgi:transcriptional regulator with GAF, ATPase, and Fis domain